MMPYQIPGKIILRLPQASPNARPLLAEAISGYNTYQLPFLTYESNTLEKLIKSTEKEEGGEMEAVEVATRLPESIWNSQMFTKFKMR